MSNQLLIESKYLDFANISVGNLVSSNPHYAPVFEEHGIDYCCGGKCILHDVCQEKGIDLILLLEKFVLLDSKAVAEEPDWNKSSLKDLIDHIISVYHIPLRGELERIEALSRKVANVHGERLPNMKEVAGVFANFKMQLELHMQKEEIILFPAIVKFESGNAPQFFGCGGGIENPINVMLQEHDDAAESLKKMRALASDYLIPDGSCNTYCVLIDALKRLESEMHMHVHKENNILFPRALSLVQPPLTSCSTSC